MEKTNKNTYKILLDYSTMSNLDLRLIRLNEYAVIRRYNSEKFSRILADKIVFINANNGRDRKSVV